MFKKFLKRLISQIILHDECENGRNWLANLDTVALEHCKQVFDDIFMFQEEYCLLLGTDNDIKVNEAHFYPKKELFIEQEELDCSYDSIRQEILSLFF